MFNKIDKNHDKIEQVKSLAVGKMGSDPMF